MRGIQKMNKIVIRKICSKTTTEINEKYISRFRRKKILNSDFSIISNNCWLDGFIEGMALNMELQQLDYL